MKKELKSPLKYYFLTFHPTRENWDEGIFILNNSGELIGAKCEKEAISRALSGYIELINCDIFYKGKEQSGWELFVKIFSGYTQYFVRVISVESPENVIMNYYNPNKAGIYPHLMEGHRDYSPNAAAIKNLPNGSDASTTAIVVKDLSNDSNASTSIIYI